MLAGTDIRYDMDTGTTEPPHPLVGRWAPDLPLGTAEGKTRVARLMHEARGVLLDFTEGAALAGAAEGWKDRVDVVWARCEGQPADALLIRPDGYVAWAASADSDPGSHRAGLRHALATWFGCDPVEPGEDSQEADAPPSPP